MTDDAISGILLRAQQCPREAPTIILGSGASVAHGLPSMTALTDHVLRHISIEPRHDSPSTTAFLQHAKNVGIENALAEANLEASVHDAILHHMWSLIREKDAAVLAQLIVSSNLLPLTRLYRHLFASTHTNIHVVTTNYDRLAEYAAEAGDYAHYTGFSYGHLRRPAGNDPWQIRRGTTSARTAHIWKVHGSIDWFTTTDAEVVAGLDPQVHAPLKPLIVTPGEQKYRITHEEPFRTIISRADSAMEAARAFLIVGYGFNDEHIQPKLRESMQRREVPILVLTKELTDSGRQLICESSARNYIIFESHGSDGTCVHLADQPSTQILRGHRLWNLQEFLSTALSI